MNTKLTKGQKVNIFHDPITQKKLEGEAILVKFCHEDDHLEHWDVRFKGERTTYQRWIAKPGKIAPDVCPLCLHHKSICRCHNHISLPTEKALDRCIGDCERACGPDDLAVAVGKMTLLTVCAAARQVPELLNACKLALGALDKLMGDSDLDNDDSQEMVACQSLRVAIFKAEGRR